MFTVTKRTTKQVPVKVLSLRWLLPTALVSLRCSGCRKPIGETRWSCAWIEDSKGKRSMRLCEKCGEKAEKNIQPSERSHD